MSKLRLNRLVVWAMMIACTGCATRIFHAKFNQYNGSVGSPVGEVPGVPTGDYIVQEGNGDISFAKVSGNQLLLRQNGAGSSSGSPTWGRLNFLSIDANDLDSERILSWNGKVTSSTAWGTPSLTIDISGQESRTSIDPWPGKELRLKLGRKSAELLDYSGNSLASNSTNVSLYEDHRVFISIDLNADTCKVTIYQSSQPEVILPGTLPPATVNLLKSSSRMLVRLSFPEYNVAHSTASYAMDEVALSGR